MPLLNCIFNSTEWHDQDYVIISYFKTLRLHFDAIAIIPNKKMKEQTFEQVLRKSINHNVVLDYCWLMYTLTIPISFILVFCSCSLNCKQDFLEGNFSAITKFYHDVLFENIILFVRSWIYLHICVLLFFLLLSILFFLCLVLLLVSTQWLWNFL